MIVNKAAMAWAAKNRMVSQFLLTSRRGVRSALRATIPRGNLATFMGVGAGFGAVRGLADNIIGDDRVSVLGGAFQGAVAGAGLYGGRALFRKGLATRAAGAAVGSPAIFNRGTVPGNIITPNLGVQTRAKTLDATMRRGRLY